MTERIFSATAHTAVAMIALIAIVLPIGSVAQAATTGITVSATELTTEVDVQVNFVVTTTTDDDTVTADTAVSVTDNGAGGEFFTGTQGGDCNATNEDSDNSFSIENNKGVCYSNGTAGDYEITVSLLSSTSDLIGEAVTIAVSVTADETEASEQNAELLALIDGLINQVTDLQSQTGNTDPIPSPDGDDTNQELQAIVVALQEQIVALQALLEEDEEGESEKERLFGYLNTALFGIPAELNLDVFEDGVAVGSAVVVFNEDRTDVESFEIEFTEAFKASNVVEELQAVAVGFENPDVLFRFDYDLDTGLFLYLDYNSIDFNLFSSSAVLFDAEFDAGTSGGYETVLAFAVASGETDENEEEDDSSEEEQEEDDSNTPGSTDGEVDKCEFEGHKYDAEGNPLENWEMGLIKVITYEGQTYVYTISTAVTDLDGFYCLRWSDVWTPDYDAADFPGGYEFEYRIYETNQPDWEFVSAEHGLDYQNLAITTLDLLTFTDTQVQHMVGEPNGYVIADAEYHVDFYNLFVGETATNTGTSTGGETGTTTPTTTSSGSGGGGSSSPRCDLFTVVELGDTLVLEWETRRGRDLVITAEGETVFETTDDDVVDQGQTVIANGGQRAFELTVARGSRDRSCEVILEGPTPTVAGISDATPQSTVAGDQVSLIPVGGANGGAGGTTSMLPSALTLMLVTGVAVALQARRFLNV